MPVKLPRAQGMAAYVRNSYGAFRQPKFECGCCEMQAFMVCGVRQKLHMFSLCRNPDLDDNIFYCLLASMAAVQAEDVRASFLFVGDLNCHHQEWLSSTTVAESLIRDLVGVSEWCDLRGMKLKESLSKTMIVSRSRTMNPQSPPLTIGGTGPKESDDLVI